MAPMLFRTQWFHHYDGVDDSRHAGRVDEAMPHVA